MCGRCRGRSHAAVLSVWRHRQYGLQNGIHWQRCGDGDGDGDGDGAKCGDMVVLNVVKAVMMADVGVMVVMVNVILVMIAMMMVLLLLLLSLSLLLRMRIDMVIVQHLVI